MGDEATLHASHCQGACQVRPHTATASVRSHCFLSCIYLKSALIITHLVMMWINGFGHGSLKFGHQEVKLFLHVHLLITGDNTISN